MWSPLISRFYKNILTPVAASETQDSGRNLPKPTRTNDAYNDEEQDESAIEMQKCGNILPLLKDDTLSFISVEVLGNQKSYQNIVFSKMKELLNQGFLENISSKKIDYFFCSIYTIAYLIHKQPNWRDIDRRRMQNKIKNATILAKNTLIDSLLRLERIQKNDNESTSISNAVVSPIDKMIDQDDEEIDKLISKLREKKISIEDIEQARLNNVRILTIREMEEYNESLFEEQNSKHSQHYHKRSTSSSTSSQKLSGVNNFNNYLDHDQEGYEEEENEEGKEEEEEEEEEEEDHLRKGRDGDEEDDSNDENEDKSKEKEDDEEDYEEVKKHRHKRRFEDVSDNDNTSSDSYYEAEPKAILKTSMTKTKASRRSYKAPPLKAVNTPLKAVNVRKGADIFLYDLKNTVDKIYDYKKYFIFDMKMIFNADEVKKYASSLRSLGRMQLTPAEKLINHKSKKCKGRTISTLELSRKGANLSKEFIDSVMKKLISKRIIRADSFPCGSTGKATTIDLITSLSGARQQEFHSDYDPDDFDPAENRQYAQVREASILFNHTTDTQYLACLERPFLLELPPLSFIVMRGDFVHAGCENKTKKVLSRLFLYLDPYEGYRALAANEVYLCNFKK